MQMNIISWINLKKWNVTDLSRLVNITKSMYRIWDILYITCIFVISEFP